MNVDARPGVIVLAGALVCLAIDRIVAQEIGQPIVRTATARSIELVPLQLSPARIWQPGDPVRVKGDLQRRGQIPQLQRAPGVVGPDPLLQAQSIAGAVAAPTVLASFDGIPATGFLPPDVIGAVGPNHYIQMVNAAFAIFDKKGTRLAGPAPINSVWRGFGGPCESENNGDPVPRYDHLADRWIISQFALDAHFQCIAISRGPDPVADGWFLYAFPTVTGAGTPVTPDYPKLTVWPDGYYMGTQRGFPGSGLDVWVFEREKMLLGQPARQIQFSVGPPSLFLMPSDLNGPPPAAGIPNPFIRHVDGQLYGGSDRVEIFELTANWPDPPKSTFKKVQQLPVTPFNSTLCSDSFGGICAAQPGTSRKLETIPAWMMWRLQYRNFGAHDTLVVNHAVNADGRNRAGIRWYEFRRQSGGAWSKAQEGTHSPDSNHRFMGSIAMDAVGNMALGYSLSGSTVFPSIAVALRRPSDPAGTMAQGETILVQGKGSQTSSSGRWGDYSSMDVDPSAPCTFWYTNMYYPATSEAGWRTRIIAFHAPQCPTSEKAQ
jgi:hypothetical protein